MGNIILFPVRPHKDYGTTPRWPVLCNERLGGLLKFYYRSAA
jgi:hypothetical protein